LTKALVSTMIEAHDRMSLDDPAVLDRTVFVDTDGVSATDFDLDANRREILFANGRQAAERFLVGWDFDRYLKTYR
jgi:NTE family protein